MGEAGILPFFFLELKKLELKELSHFGRKKRLFRPKKTVFYRFFLIFFLLFFCSPICLDFFVKVPSIDVFVLIFAYFSSLKTDVSSNMTIVVNLRYSEC